MPWVDECPCCGESFHISGAVYDGQPLPCGCGCICADEDGAHVDTSGCEQDHNDPPTPKEI